LAIWRFGDLAIDGWAIDESLAVINSAVIIPQPIANSSITNRQFVNRQSAFDNS
jgi:hypothetical protein